MSTSRPRKDDLGSEWIGIIKAARMLHVHPNTLRRWADQKLIGCMRVGPRGDRHFNRAELRDTARFTPSSIPAGPRNLPIKIADDMLLDPQTRSLHVSGETVVFTEKEFILLYEVARTGSATLMALRKSLRNDGISGSSPTGSGGSCPPQ